MTRDHSDDWDDWDDYRDDYLVITGMTRDH